jgi:hypothetical protein
MPHPPPPLSLMKLFFGIGPEVGNALSSHYRQMDIWNERPYMSVCTYVRTFVRS